jgi:hypothetical protein
LRNIESSNLIDIWEKLPEDWKLPLKGGGKHNEDSKYKEDSQKDFQYGFIENLTT